MTHGSDALKEVSFLKFLKKHFSVYSGLPGDVYILFAAIVVNKAGSFIMPMITLILTVKAGFSESAAGLITTIAVVTQAPFLALGGKLSDSFGSKKIIVIFDVAGALAYLICGFLMPGLAVVILIVIASDLFAVASPAFTALVAEVTPPSSIKSAYSLTYLGNNLGFAVGPAIGGLLFNAHLNLLFILDAATGFLGSAIILFKVRNTKRAEPAVEAGGDMLDAKASVFAFLRRQPFLIVFSAILLIYNFCYIQWSFLLPLQMVDVFKENGSRLFSLLFSTNALTVIVFTPLLTSLTQRVKPVTSIAVGGILYAASYFIFAVSGITPLFFAGVVVMTVGEILISYNTNSYIALRTPASHLSRANSLLLITSGTGYAIGPALMGSLLTVTSIRSAWLIVFGIMLFGVLSMGVFRRFDRRNMESIPGCRE